MKPALHSPRIGKTLLAAAGAALLCAGCAGGLAEWNTNAYELRKKGIPIPMVRVNGSLGDVSPEVVAYAEQNWRDASTASGKGNSGRRGTQVAQAGGSRGYARNAGQPIEGDITSAKALAFLYGGKVSQYSRPQKSSGKQSAVEAHAEKILQAAGKGGSGDSPLGEECWEFVSWTPPVVGKYREYFEHHEEYKGQPMVACTLLDARYVENGVQKFMLGTSTYSHDILKGGAGDGWAPLPIIGVAIFASEGGQWKLEAEDKYVTTGAWFQQSATLQRVGPEKWGMLLDYVQYLGGGYVISGLSLLMPYGGGIKEYRLGAGSNDGEGDDAGRGNFSVSFDTASTGEYYDAVLRYTVPHGSKTVKKTERLRFQNGEYVKAKTAKKASAKKRK